MLRAMAMKSVSRLQVHRHIPRLRKPLYSTATATLSNIREKQTHAAQTHSLSLSNLEAASPIIPNQPTQHPLSKVISPSPLQQYHTLVETGSLRKDDSQTRIIQILQDLHDQLVNYKPPNIPQAVSTTRSILSRIFSVSSPELASTIQPPRGLYLYGDVGTGKTMLMDLFYNTLPTSIKRKRRVHFHAFMIDVHKRIHAVKLTMGHDGGDPIPIVTRELAQQATVLCFDEFQVTDIADAMILRRLLEGMKDHGVVMVVTSNRHPDDLYKNGIQRASFIPCIDLLKEHLDVTDLNSGTDYRRIPRALSHVYYDPLTDENCQEVEKIFRALASSDPSDPIITNRSLETWGRNIVIPESSSSVAKFTFEDLCSKPLSAADYLEITKKFGTVFVLGVPKLGMDAKDKARRFITFIDACYESRTKLLVTSEVPIQQIFSDDSKDTNVMSDHLRSIMDDLGLSVETVGVSSMFSGEEEFFAFARCCSRLVQMGSKEWAEMLQ